MSRLGLVGEISDQIDLVNPFRGQEGLNAHKCYGYFVNAGTGATIADWWRAPGPASPQEGAPVGHGIQAARAMRRHSRSE
jgi:hypothetical protein